MGEVRPERRLRSYLIGGVLGASAAVAAIRRHPRNRRQPATGLGAFESAPCYRESIERSRNDGP